MAPRLKIGKVGSAEGAARKTVASIDGQPGRPIARPGSGDRPASALAGMTDGDAATRLLAHRRSSGSGT